MTGRDLARRSILAPLRRGVLTVAASLFFAVGCGGGEESTPEPDSGAPEKKAAVEPLARPLEATCAELGFGNDRFPKANEKWTFQAGNALAEEYRDAAPEGGKALGVMFSTLIVGACNKTQDPSYQPVPQVRVIADDARELADDTGTDFMATLSVTGVGDVRGAEEIDADAAFIDAANGVCRSASPSVRPLVKKIWSQGDSSRVTRSDSSPA